MSSRAKPESIFFLDVYDEHLAQTGAVYLPIFSIADFELLHLR